MTPSDPPSTAPDPAEATPLVLPRPNPDPEPWSEPTPAWGPTELALGAILAAAAVVLAVRKRRHRRATPAAIDAAAVAHVAEAEPSPGLRLIASSHAVRAALIAEFGPTWGSRTTEEIARDPTLIDRLGDETARAVVAYLQRVDRAKFAAEEVEDVEGWIDRARDLLDRIPRPAPPRPAPRTPGRPDPIRG